MCRLRASRRGGNNVVGMQGTFGYLQAVAEIAEQQKAMGVTFDHIVFACGSGGTAAGIALGVKLSGITAKVSRQNASLYDCMIGPRMSLYWCA
jgi:1-aminocyclopropane-1-carboxylate deaminase/D-cysteine desulfhydrase-like pyridoxal-dependent ACC family enzyme